MRLVNFVDAFAIGRLMAIRTTLCQSGRGLRLVHINRQPGRVLAITGLFDVLAPDEPRSSRP